jgi:ubiquinone/menaquinone biosynthesis C-methylase UbiE
MNSGLQSAYRERSKIYDALSGLSPWHRLYRERTEREIERALAKLSFPLRILDAGGGTGLTAQWLARMGHRVVLVDAVPEMLDSAREKARKTPFDIYQGDVGNLDFLEPESFDVIVCTQVLNFCPDAAAVFRAFHRLLRKGGLALADIDTAFRWSLIEALSGDIENAMAIANGRDREGNIVGADYYFHSKLDLFATIQEAGLRVDGSWGVAYVAPYIHLYATSKDFVDPRNLPERARFFAEEKNFARLSALENLLSNQALPDEMAGYLQFTASKPLT